MLIVGWCKLRKDISSEISTHASRRVRTVVPSTAFWTNFSILLILKKGVILTGPRGSNTLLCIIHSLKLFVLNAGHIVRLWWTGGLQAFLISWLVSPIQQRLSWKWTRLRRWSDEVPESFLLGIEKSSCLKTFFLVLLNGYFTLVMSFLIKWLMGFTSKRSPTK